MSFLELLLLAVGVSMDAFAISICCGLHANSSRPYRHLEAGLYFGGFQALMPLLGYYLCAQFQSTFLNYGDWIAFALLAYIGISMIIGTLRKSTEKPTPSMLILAIASSIDAFVVGISLGFIHVNIFKAITLIGLITCILSIVGVRIGMRFSVRLKTKAEIVGGLILLAMGVKILIVHLFT